MNTAQRTSATAITGPVTSSIAFRGCLARRHPLLEPALDVLDHHDRIVHHDSDRQHQPEKEREIVERIAEHGHDGEGADDGDRDGDQSG